MASEDLRVKFGKIRVQKALGECRACHKEELDAPYPGEVLYQLEATRVQTLRVIDYYEGAAALDPVLCDAHTQR